MRPRRLLAVIISASVLALAFLFPAYAGWLAGFFLVPLAWSACSGLRFPWRLGIAWGLLFWPVQSFGLLVMCLEHGHGPARWILVPSLVALCVGMSGVWFLSAQLISDRMYYPWWRCVSWIVAAWFFFMFMHGYAFSWIGYRCGYPLALPILPLMGYTWCVRAVGLTGAYGFVFILFCAQFTAVYAVCHGWRYLIGSVPLAVVLVMSAWPHVLHEPAVLAQIGCIVPPCDKGMTCLDRAEAIDIAVGKLCAVHPQVRVVIAPESSYPYPLNEHEVTRKLWAENCLADKEIRLIIGAYWREDGRIYNALCCAQECLIIYRYVKNQLMPFAECIPPTCRGIAGACSLFTQGTDLFNAPAGACTRRERMQLLDDLYVQPCLCSELFFDTIGRESRDPVLCLVNDSWFSIGFMRELLRLYARMAAAHLRRDLIYVSYAGGWWFGKDGGESSLHGICS